MAMRQYIGARYVPAYFENSATGDSTWAANTIYEALTIVVWNNNEYTSKKPVPASVGNPADNPTYWIATSNITGQIAHLQDQFNDLSDEVENISDDVTDIQGDVSTINGKVSNLETSVSNLNTSLGTANSNITSLQSSVSTLSSSVATNTQSISDINDDISDIEDDIDDINTAIAGLAGMEAVTYWTNEGSTETFNAQTIYNANYNILEYKFIEITFLLSGASGTAEYETCFAPIIDSANFALNGTSRYIRIRDFVVSSSGVAFAAGKYWTSYGASDPTTGNQYCVPIKIQLIK